MLCGSATCDVICGAFSVVGFVTIAAVILALIMKRSWK